MRRLHEWIREEEVEEWMKVKHITPKYRFTVKEKAELKVGLHMMDDCYTVTTVRALAFSRLRVVP